MKIYLEKCPKCKKENYAINVSLGICTWCSYKATEEDARNYAGVWEGKSE